MNDKVDPDTIRQATRLTGASRLIEATALLQQTPKPTDEQITDAMVGNICRCGTYLRIRKAIKSAARSM